MVLIMKSGRKYHLRRIYWYMSLWLKKMFCSDAKERNTYALKKLSFDIELMRNHILTFHTLRLELYFFFFSIDRIRLLFLKKKFFMTCIVSDFLITFHRSKFLKTSYSLKKTIFKSKWKVKTKFSWSVNHNKGNVKIRKEPL